MTEAVPTVHRIPANGLEQRVLEWRPRRDVAATALLCHGFMDAAGTWDRVAPLLADAGIRVLAPDLRGFGEGPRAPAGSYYHFPDYVADVAGIVQALAPDEKLCVVGHSMGGTVATLFAGTLPESVARLVNIEGCGPPDNGFDIGPLRMRRWIQELRTTRAGSRIPRAEARRRLALNHPGVPPEVLDTRFEHLVRDEGDGLVTWLFDPLHRTTSPMPFFARLFVEYAKLVTCPVLFVSGGETGFHVPDEEERLRAFAQLDRVTLEGAGHMVHWTRPAELAARIVAFCSVL